MADIKQAAKWMQDGEAVKRPHHYDGHYAIAETDDAQLLVDEYGRAKKFILEDLLANDWEIAE